MFEDTVLRFSDKERQQQLAEQEQALAQRRASLEARQKNLAYRQDWLKREPHAVAQAVEREDQQRREDKQLATDAKALKTRFGLKDGEVIDTAAMRGALEQALAEKEVEQAQRAEQITDRASLLSGLNKLALIDARKTAEILHANKDLNVPREWSRQEIADMFAKAQSRVDGRGATRTYPKTLDGWSKSLEARSRELDLAEIKLDAQEQALRAQVRRAIEGPEKTAAQPVPELVQKAADRSVEVAAGKGAVAAAKESVSIDTSLETLKDPAKFAATVDTVAKTTGVSAEQAKATLEMLRETKEANAGRAPDAMMSDKAAIDAARNAFFSRGSGRSTAPVEKVAERAAAKPTAQKSNVIEMGTGKRTPSAAPVENSGQTLEAKKAVDGVAGFKKLGRNKTKDAADRGAPDAGKSADAGKTQQTEGASVVRVETRPRKNFSELNAHEKLERRAEFFGNLRESAGFTRDGKQAVSERAREAVRPGKQREGHGIG
ncbi:hypothetical protein A6V36_35805 [Paraburkholderia ginsengiterrae]|uniref:Uncharacterized protein n=1 Tax=Paraburkholderia ginsengiterrae TaxID=1462993 RepID=A0A1A9N0R2_9BURK|nr:hypothetical protein [Paraburkholderia ginsengiterrae]OAJ54651.1 hypothetical protein A6V36_35805 [Paraburkholderia ginsengiterrae]OAJ55344.1 hypothetical protein A6V37_33220 [Paraburkholderia ginsengiterrae]